jgi:hypothetical protein
MRLDLEVVSGRHPGGHNSETADVVNVLDVELVPAQAQKEIMSVTQRKS